MQGNHRISLGYSWVSTTLQSRHGLSTSDCVSLFRKHGGVLRWASAVGRRARSYVGVTGSLTSHGVISRV